MYFAKKNWTGACMFIFDSDRGINEHKNGFEF